MIPFKNIIPMSSFKKNLSQYIDQSQNDASPLIITRDGKAAGVFMNADQYESMMETLEILGNKKIMKSLERSKKDIEAGRLYTMEEVFGDED